MRAGFISRRFLLLLLVVVFLYLSMYTWNLRYGYLDRLSEITGMEIAGWLLRPGNWVATEADQRWSRYVHLVGVEQENERLRGAVSRMALSMASLREDSARARRLESYLEFKPPEMWARQGARVIAHRLGPTGTLETFLVDKGGSDGIYDDAPVITPDGVVGRVMRVSPSASTVLLLNDPNSRIPVLGRDSRTTGILVGQGPGQLLAIDYVPLNEPMGEGEILVSSGLARVFPKGIPVARVVSVERSDISLFKTVLAEPLVDVRNLEQVLVLTRLSGQPAAQVQAQAAPAQPAAAAAKPPAVQPPKPQAAQAQKPLPGQTQQTAQPQRTQPAQTQASRQPAAQERMAPAPQASARTPAVSAGVPGTLRSDQAPAPATATSAGRSAAQDMTQPAPQPAAQDAADPGSRKQQSPATAPKPRAEAQAPAARPSPEQGSMAVPPATPVQDSQARRQPAQPADGSPQQAAWPPALQTSSAPAPGQTSSAQATSLASPVPGAAEPAGQTPAQPAAQAAQPAPPTPASQSPAQPPASPSPAAPAE